ncbi:MAG: hypothetical protein OCC45_16215 [Desulfotalea sp.]
MFNKLNNFIKYLSRKKSEITDLETKDALLAKTVLDIHRKRTHSAFVVVPLFALKPIHAIDRENAIKATEGRVKILLEAKTVLLQKKDLTREILAEYLPSVSGIKVVKNTESYYISYEGNGRLVAMQKVFSPSDSINIEVEEYYFRDPVKILKRMLRVRILNGLMD